MQNNILVTGAKGFIGKNIVIRLKEQKYNVLEYDVDNAEDDLNSYISDCNSIIHLAGVNRPKDQTEFISGNTDFTKKLIDKVKKENRVLPVVMSSSIQAGLDNPYGKSKKKAEDELLSYIETGGLGSIFRLHNVYGKWSCPNYNTVVATFCNNIALGLDIKIDAPEKVIELVYIDDVIDAFLRFIDNPIAGLNDYQYIEKTNKISLGELANKLFSYKECLQTGVVPNLKDQFNKNLFSMFLSYNSKESIIQKPKLNTDDRGWLFEFIKSEETGQIFISTTKPGITRGNHYHHTKIEKFCVIKGSGKISLRNIISNKLIEYTVDGSSPDVVHIPPGYTHNITNTGEDEMIAIFWANEIFNNNKPDTFFKEV